MCNEVFFGQYTTQQTALLTKMVAATHQLDSTRLAAIGGCQRNGYDAYGDVSGYNGDGATLYMNPVKPNIVTEYGSCTEDRPGSFNACWGNVQITSDSANQFAWRSGVTLWCAFHHGSNANMGNMGMIDHARLPLERWYYYRQKNLGIAPPTWPSSGTASKLAIITDRAALTDDGTTDAHLIVQIQNSSGTLLANTANITLTDASGLGLFPSVAPAGGTSITFTGNAVDQGVRVGQCAIEYRAYNAGAATITASSNGLTSGTTTIVINHAVDSPIVYPLTGVQERQTAARGPRIMRQERFVGNSVTVPRELRGRECAVALYSLQGKCMKAMYLKGTATSIKIDNAATTAMIARFTTR
jgi:beta-galactosidase